MRKSLLLALVLLAMAPAAVLADTTYSYVGTPFNGFHLTACPPTCRITGSFTVADPLAPNLMGVNTNAFVPLSFSFTDGTTTWTPLDTADSGFGVNTDSSGHITFYSIFADLLGGGDISIYYEGTGFTTQLFASNNIYSAFYDARDLSGGTWTESTTTAPEPSSLLLLGAGLFALAGLTFKKSMA